MRKYVIGVLICLLLAGCNQSDIVLKEKYETYKLHYQSILNSTQFKQTSSNYNISTSLTALSDGNYRYDVFVDEPKIAMYDDAKHWYL